MFLFYLLIAFVGASQVATLQPNKLPASNSFELNAIQQLLKERQELSDIDPNLLAAKKPPGSSKSLITDIIIGLLLRDLTKTSNFPTLVATNISEKCHNDSQDYYTANLLLVNWANQMFESTGKLPDGLFNSLNLHANGHFDECINIQAEWTNTSFTGKYCTVFLDSARVMPDELEDENNQVDSNQRSNWLSIFDALVWLYDGPTLKEPKVRDTDRNSKYLPSADFCIPSSCSMQDFRYAVAQLIGSRAIDNFTDEEGNNYYTSMVAVTDEKYCYTKETIKATPQFDGADIAVIVTLSVLGFVILMATAFELWNVYNNRPIQSNNKNNFGLKLLHCFSMLTNSQKLLSAKSSAVDNLACLNGIRVLSTTWIVLYHTYYEAIINPMSNAAMFIEDAMTWQVHGILNATIAVDTFFLMSALLVTYSLMRELDRNKGRFNIALFYLHRYLRLTPVYAVILGFIATLLAYLGAGPNWQTIRELSVACRWNWWNNLLYVNNYVLTYPLECMGETWYLACDMQMFLLSPLFIYPLWKWWKAGLAWSLFSIASLIGGTIAIYIVWDLPAMGFFTRDTSNPHYYYGYYVQMWTRFPPYILGILLGWALHRTKKTTIKMNKYVVVIGWILAVLIGLAVVYGMVPYLDPEEVPEIKDGIRVSYGSLHRLAWATSVAWIVFACIHGYGGYVNRFLSWKAFIPLARLTYVVYLIHLNYLTVFHAFARKPTYFTKFYHTEHYFGTILMVFFMAFGICLTVEVPLLNLERLLLPSRTKKPEAVVDIERDLKTATTNAGNELKTPF